MHFGSWDVASFVIENIISSITCRDQGSADEEINITQNLDLNGEEGSYVIQSSDIEDNLSANDAISSDSDEYQSEVIASTSQGNVVSEYERIRMRIIADREAAFKELYPSFEEEMRALKGKKTSKKRPKTPSVGLLPTRSSSRIRQKVSAVDFPEHHDISNMTGQGSMIVTEEENFCGFVVPSTGDCIGAASDGKEGIEADAIDVVEMDAFVASEVEVRDQNEGAEQVQVGSSGAEISDSRIGKYACLTCDKSFR